MTVMTEAYPVRAQLLSGFGHESSIELLSPSTTHHINAHRIGLGYLAWLGMVSSLTGHNTRSTVATGQGAYPSR